VILSQNLEVAAALTVVHKLGYAKAASDYALLDEFFDGLALPYFPMPGIRVTGASSLAWYNWIAIKL
jgi:hypothetical protein